jgi:hypothetical protein
MGTGARLTLVCVASDFAKGASLNQWSQEGWQSHAPVLIEMGKFPQKREVTKKIGNDYIKMKHYYSL